MIHSPDHPTPSAAQEAQEAAIRPTHTDLGEPLPTVDEQVAIIAAGPGVFAGDVFWSDGEHLNVSITPRPGHPQEDGWVADFGSRFTEDTAHYVAAAANLAPALLAERDAARAEVARLRERSDELHAKLVTARHTSDGWRERATRAEAECGRLREGLEWALDLLDMYDQRMVQLGDPPELVYSEVHLAGKRKARAALAAREGKTNG